jgi:hypothetical protein
VPSPYGDIIHFFLLIAQLPISINSSFLQLALNLFPNLTGEKRLRASLTLSPIALFLIVEKLIRRPVVLVARPAVLIVQPVVLLREVP